MPATARRAASTWRIPLLFLAALTAAELLTVFSAPAVGMTLHAALLMGFFALALFSTKKRDQQFYLALSLAPLIRVISLVLPLTLFPPEFWYMVVGLPLFLAAFVVARICTFRRQHIGMIRRGWFFQLLFGLTGISLGYVEYLILRPEPLVPEFNWFTVLAVAISLLVFTGFLEEYIFRGLMQFTAIRTLGRAGLVYISLVFAVLHIGYRSLLDVVFVFIVAMFFSLITQRTSSLLGVTLAHGLTNITLFLVFPFIFI